MDEALTVRHLSMTFGGQKALDNVSISVRRGEVHGLVGQNGSGKSTFIKILAGYHHPDSGGELEVDGHRVLLPLQPGAFRNLGLSFVHQDLGLLPSLTVVENFLAWKFSTTSQWRVQWGMERRRAEKALARFGLDLDASEKVANLSAVERALLAIVRAIEDMAERNAGDGERGSLLLLDEPTVFLPSADRDRLFDVVRKTVALGASVLFVSHDLDEALGVTDRVTVLRDGQVAGTVVSAETSKDQLVEMIIGRRLEVFSASRGAHAAGSASHFTVDGLTGGIIDNVSFALEKGEVLGLTGLLGSGFEDIPYFMFGAKPVAKGRLAVAGVEHDLIGMTPAAAIKAGMALVPSDRQDGGGVGSLLVRDNVMLQVLDRYRGRCLKRGRLLEDSRAALEQYDVRPPDPLMDFQALSGGNQQKVVLAKWLQAEPMILLVHEPTQGVDVGARQQIFELIRRAVIQGMSVVCASSDHEQLSSICDRVLIFDAGMICGELAGDHISKDRITEQCYKSGRVSVSNEGLRQQA